jgi:hypothetical protein
MPYPVRPQVADESTFETFDLPLLADSPAETLPVFTGQALASEESVEGMPAFQVSGQQAALRIEPPVFLLPESRLQWWWRKPQGEVCIIQLTVINTETNQQRYFGYGAGALTEPPSADPTIEVFVSDTPPRDWTRVERPVAADIERTLGWESAKVTEVYFSPWDGTPGLFAGTTLHDVAAVDLARERKRRELEHLSSVGRGAYTPLPLRDEHDRHVATFHTSFEECAPGRNSAANEWSAFGAIGDRDFNAMGRDMRVRYPAFDLVFRLGTADDELAPDSRPDFCLGLVQGRMPAIQGSWTYAGLAYTVAAMTVPDPVLGNYDLFRLEVTNPGDRPLPGSLIAGIDGAPDLRLGADAVVRALGDAPMLIAARPTAHDLTLRDWGLCDKRAKGYVTGPAGGGSEEALGRARIGLDGLPVVYRFRAEPDRRYTVFVAAPVHVRGYYVQAPVAAGDLVWEYTVEGAAPARVDPLEAVPDQDGPVCVGFTGCRDVDGDGYVQVTAGVAPDSRIRHTCLAAIYVFPDDVGIDDPEAVFSGSLNDRCVRHIDVGLTPEQWWSNQSYNQEDIGLARLDLHYTETVPPGTTSTYWIRVPPIHRREPASMGNIAHAFREILPGEAVPPFAAEQIRALSDADPAAAVAELVRFWEGFWSGAARFELPDPILNDIYLSRLATRAIHDVPISQDVVYNTCSPFFYFDHAYRDQAYVVYALDLAGLHDRAERLLRAYCMDVDEITDRGGIAFDGQPLQLGMLENGLWYTRPGQYDTQGENLWCLVQHYKLSGDRDWLAQTAYPYVRRGAMWIVNSRHRHMQEVGDPDDPRHGLIEPGGMEVLEVGQGMHMYYMNAFAILGLREAHDAAASLGRTEDAERFGRECAELTASLHRSFRQTFRRTGLYEGHLWFGVEPEGVGMYGFWAHNCLLWPCRAVDPFDPGWNATLRRLEDMAGDWGGGLHSEGEGSYWPYIGVDRAIGHILRGEPDMALDYFCAFTDVAGGTLSWGEGYQNVIAMGDQPHFWADAQWLNLFRQLFVFEDGPVLMITPALFRRWHQDEQEVRVSGLPTHFGDLDLEIRPDRTGTRIEYRLRVSSKGDQASRALERILLCVRAAGGRPIRTVTVNGRPCPTFTRDTVVLPSPERGRTLTIEVETEPTAP